VRKSPGTLPKHAKGEELIGLILKVFRFLSPIAEFLGLVMLFRFLDHFSRMRRFWFGFMTATGVNLMVSQG
jgi:hypothetical protein